MDSLAGIPIIAAICHTVDGKGDHRAPGTTSGTLKWKAQCATNLLRQLVHHRERKRSSAALASSQGQAPVPSIIMTGDLNVTRQALKEEMGVMYFDDIEEDREMSAVQQGNRFAIADCEVELYEGLPSITGADNRHEVACCDISVARQPVFPTPEDRTRMDDELLEQGRKVFADMQSAREAALAATQGQGMRPARCPVTQTR